mgnify:CR=1 FL=1
MKLTKIQAELLLAFYEAENETMRYSDFAEKYGMKNYQVSRIGKTLSEMGLVDRTNPQKLTLTEAGKSAAEDIFTKIKTASAYMRHEDVDEDDIHGNALIWALQCTNSLFDAADTIVAHAQVKSFFEQDTLLTGTQLAKKIGEGFYTLPFLFYNMQFNAESSHASVFILREEFRKTCEIRVHNGRGYIVLFPVMSISDTPVNQKITLRPVDNVMYWNGAKYDSAQLKNDSFLIPMEYFNFVSLGESEDAGKRLIQGSIEVSVSLSNQSVESSTAAVLTLFLN